MKAYLAIGLFMTLALALVKGGESKFTILKWLKYSVKYLEGSPTVSKVVDIMKVTFYGIFHVHGIE